MYLLVTYFSYFLTFLYEIIDLRILYESIYSYNIDDFRAKHELHELYCTFLWVSLALGQELNTATTTWEGWLNIQLVWATRALDLPLLRADAALPLLLCQCCPLLEAGQAD